MFTEESTIEGVCLPLKYLAATERDNPLQQPLRAFLKQVNTLAVGKEHLAEGCAALHGEQFALRMQAIQWLAATEADVLGMLQGMEAKWRTKATTPERKRLLKALLHAVRGQEAVLGTIEAAGHSLKTVAKQIAPLVNAKISYEVFVNGVLSQAPNTEQAQAMLAWINSSLDLETALLMADAFLSDEVDITPGRASELNLFLLRANKAFDKGLKHWGVQITGKEAPVVAEPLAVYRTISEGTVKPTAQVPVRASIGAGAYSVPEIALILGLQQNKVRRVLNELWDGKLGKKLFGDTFSITVAKHKYVSFHVLIEFFVYFELRERGVSSQRIMKSRQAMARDLDTEHPFATANVLHTKKKIWYEFKDAIVDADGTRQTNLVDIIERFCQKIDFNGDKLAVRFWPLGKDKRVVVDPKHQFGAPTVPGTNINAQVLYHMSQSGERVETLASLYDLKESDVRDAILLYERAA